LEGSLTSLKSALNQLTGMDSEDWDFEAAELTLKDTPSLNELLQSALRDREEISISERKKGIASANYSKAKFSYFPDINFNYLYYRTEGGGANLPIWNYGVSAQLPIFDFGKRGFEMAGQKQDMKSAESAIAAQELAVRHEVVEAYSNLHTQTDTHAAAKKALDYAKETKDVENVKYQQGVGDMYDLLLSLSQYYDALSQERGTYYAIFTAEKYLEFASGGKL
jgi:outer membrane protein TolC